MYASARASEIERLIMNIRALAAATMAAAMAGAPLLAAGQSAPASTQQEIQELKAQMRVLQQRLDKLEVNAHAAQSEPPVAETTPQAETEGAPPPPPVEAAPEVESGGQTPSGSGRALLLPDISLIGAFSSHVSNDKRDADRNRTFLDYAELGVQSYVYPGVKADAFIVMDRDEDHTAQVEEAYLTALHLARNVSLRVGKSKAAFGRTNLLHSHSWLYITPPAVLSTLVAPESLAGQGMNVSYLLPARGKWFAQLDAGLWNSPEETEFGDPSNTSTILTGPGAAFNDRFGTARLWTAYSPNANGEVELGFSHAAGKGALPPGAASLPDVRLSGADLSWRRFQGNNKRLLLRGEYYRHHNRLDGVGDSADGFYLLADQRLSAYREYGLRYDWTEYPYAPGLHQSGISGIFTSQLTEQTYLRMQLTHGDRPGKSGVNEVWLQWVWGVGPHTHNLE